MGKEFVVRGKEMIERSLGKLGEYFFKESFFPRLIEYGGKRYSIAHLATRLKEDAHFYMNEHHVPLSMEDDIYLFIVNKVPNAFFKERRQRAWLKKELKKELNIG